MPKDAKGKSQEAAEEIEWRKPSELGVVPRKMLVAVRDNCEDRWISVERFTSRALRQDMKTFKLKTKKIKNKK